LDREGAYLFYMHPWEIDPGQPVVKTAPRRLSWRHYLNLKTTFAKLERMLQSLQPAVELLSCRDYLKRGLPA
jgi:hypothetical protein